MNNFSSRQSSASGGLLWLLKTFGDSLGNARAFDASPVQFFLALSQGRGGFRDIVPYAFFESTPVYLVNDPESVEHLLTSSAYTKGGTRLFEVAGRIMGRGLFTNEGQPHLQQRRLLHPVFHQGLPRVEGPVAEATRNMLDRWAEMDVLDIQEELLQLFLDILCASLIGGVSQQEQQHLASLVEGGSQLITELLGSLFILPEWIPVPLNRQLQREARSMRSMIIEIVRRRQFHNVAAEDRTFLDDLLQLHDRQHKPGDYLMSMEHIYDEVATLLFGGYRSTAVWLMWTWYLLSQQPDAEERVQAEVASVLGDRSPTVADLAHLPYLDMVLKESLRLYPPVWIIGRRVKSATVLGKIPLARGSQVIICPYTLHRHPSYWQYPDAFYPEHFQKDLVRARPKYALCPFSAGPHMCMGNKHAETVIKLVLIIVMQHHYRLRLDPPDHPVQLAARDALFATNGMPMRLSKAFREA